MLSEFEILNWFAPLFEAARFANATRLHICDLYGFISLRSHTHTTDQHPVIYTLTRRQLTKGFTLQQWDVLALTIAIYMKGNPQCNLSSKPYPTPNSNPSSNPATSPGNEPPSQSYPTPDSASPN